MMSANLEIQSTLEQRLATLASQVGNVKNSEVNPKPEAEQQSMDSPANLIHLLVGVVAQLARVDKTIAQMTEGAPEAPEAKQWFEISLQALQCSRKTLADKQAHYLKQLSAAASAPDSEAEPKAAVEADTAATPDSTPTPAPAPVSQDAPGLARPPPGLDAPPGLAAPAKSPSWMGWSKAAVESCPEFVPAQNAVVAKKDAPLEAGGDSLRQDLELLRASGEPERVIIVRKIKKLGFESPAFLTEYFGQYGEVSQVLVAHSHVKPTAKRPNGRVRPAALGFVVMANAAAAEGALNHGATHVVSGVAIEVSPFTAFDDVEDNEE